MSATSRQLRVLAVALVATALPACGGNMADLDQYINSIKARPGEGIEALPEITPYRAFTYVADAQGVRSPFVPDTPQAAEPGLTGGARPDPDRSPEFLEQFPLDTLRMVGTLYLDATMYALIQTSDGLIHRVIPGNYIGQNYGRITSISESEVALVEIISDGIGGYIERDAAVGLAD